MTRADLLLKCDIQNIINNGTKDENPRPHYPDGTPAHTYFVNHVVRKYRLDKGEFPICTLRPIAWKSAIKEVLWIYQDQSNSLDVLENKYGIQWWREWESKDMSRTIGVRYGETVRRHNLINNLLNDIRENPYGRRHIMSLWQEEDFKASDGLLPCAYETIWNVRREYLDMVLILDKFKNIKLNFNLVPVLLDALIDYGQNGLHDIHSRLSYILLQRF